MDPEVDVLAAEADAVHHLAAVDARVVALQGPIEGQGVVVDLHAFGHRPVQPAPDKKVVIKVKYEIFILSFKHEILLFVNYCDSTFLYEQLQNK